MYILTQQAMQDRQTVFFERYMSLTEAVSLPEFKFSLHFWISCAWACEGLSGYFEVHFESGSLDDDVEGVFFTYSPWIGAQSKLIYVLNGDAVHLLIVPPYLARHSHALDFELARETGLIVPQARFFVHMTFEVLQRITCKVCLENCDFVDFYTVWLSAIVPRNMFTLKQTYLHELLHIGPGYLRHQDTHR